MDEQWRLIAGYNRYECSNLGRIRDSKTDRIIFTFPNSRSGYRITCMVPDGRMKKKTVHTAPLIAATWLGPRPQGFQIDHKDGDKLHEAIMNLEYVSQAENIQRSYDNGQHPFQPGPDRYLTSEEYAQIKALWATRQHSQIQLGRMFGISNSGICKIVNGKTHPRQYPGPNSYRSMKPERLRQIVRLRAQGAGKKTIAKTIGLSLPTTRRYVRELDDGLRQPCQLKQTLRYGTSHSRS
jgi:hypothetical protein